MLGSKRIERACARWKESYQSGTLGAYSAVLSDEGLSENQDGQENHRRKTTVERCHQQEELIRKLRAENEFLWQMCQMRENRDRNLTSAEICQIIENVTQQDDYRRCISCLCKVAGISSSTFYKYRRRTTV